MAAVAGCTHGEIMDGKQRHRVDARDAVVSQRQRPQGTKPNKGQGARAQGLEADVPHGQGRQRTCDRGTQQPAEAKQWSSVQATLPSWRVGCMGEAWAGHVLRSAKGAAPTTATGLCESRRSTRLCRPTKSLSASSVSCREQQRAYSTLARQSPTWQTARRARRRHKSSTLDGGCTKKHHTG